MRYNDAGIDPRGSLWVGTMRNNVGPRGKHLKVEFTGGVLYRIDPDGAVSEWKKGLGITNTLAWSPDHRAFYFGDTTANAIYSSVYDERTGAISGEKAFIADFLQGHPDGSAIDAQGHLWNARNGGGCLIGVAPDGHVDRILSVPTLNPTNCTFGGPDLRTLYIISARSSDRLSGSVFATEVAVGGLPGGRFQLLST